MHSRLRNFFIPDDQFIESRAEYKRAMLTGYLSVVCFVISIFYAVLDFSNGIYHAWPAFAFLFITPLVSLALLRRQKFTLAKIVLMGNATLAIFYVALVDPFDTGVFMLFIPAGVGSFAMLGFQDRMKGLGLAAFSTILFLLANFGDFNLAVPIESDLTYIKVSFVLNYAISLAVTVAIVFFLGSLNESSERELLERERSEREKNEQLQKVNTELDRFVYSVSHDLRSPLSSISGLVNVAKKSTSVSELHKVADLIADRVKAQEYYIKDIIDFYKNDRANVTSEPFQLIELVREVVEETSFIPDADQIKFIIEIENSLVLNSDRARLKSVLANLIGNSIKYHAYFKHEKFIRFTASKTGNAIQLTVTDNGQGIPEEHLPKIFDMFYRASIDSKGSGLGLYIVKEIIHKLGGTIQVDSEFGEGTSFTIALVA
jgi:signal transduction histidine kinase